MRTAYDRSETARLDKKELAAVSFVVSVLRHRFGFNEAITAKEFVRKAKEYDEKYQWITEPRLRKIINHIRREKLLPYALIAGKKGYYMEPDAKKVEVYVKALSDRIAAEKATLNSFTKYINIQPNLIG